MTAAIEKRYARGGRLEGQRETTGVAAPFNSLAVIGDFREQYAPGCFSRSLASGRDVLALADHDPSRVLGRTSTGTLVLRETSAGLEYSITLPDTTTGNDIRALAARGDLGGVSVGMIVTRDRWDGDLRTIEEAELHEISIVSSWPAYTDTTVSLRARGHAINDRHTALRYWLETVR